ncbi:hypothetical protein AAVH_25786 [Aphelenchoides avenae]|nr:hypothetical protein AAVH_25786 [Aphelenchus avenae]
MMAAFLLAVLVASAAFSAVLADPPDPQAVRDCIAKLPNSTPDKNKDCNEILACVNGKRNNEECCRKEGVDLSGHLCDYLCDGSLNRQKLGPAGLRNIKECARMKNAYKCVDSSVFSVMTENECWP